MRFGQEEVWRWRKEGETGAAQMMETEKVSNRAFNFVQTVMCLSSQSLHSTLAVNTIL